jgi:thioredoxin-like negative regulator of GroEL
MDFKQKYLKYKQKYLNLQMELYTQGGGSTQSSQITLNLFKADWCDHCNTFKPTWEALQKNKQFNIKYKTFDADEHKSEIANWKIEGFPTLILQTGNKSVEFVGQKTMESISKFIQEYS